MGRARRQILDEETPRHRKQKSGYGAFPAANSGGVSLKAMNHNQSLAIASIKTNTLTLLTGCAGVGKTLIAAGVGLQLLKAGLIKHILFTKPAFEIDEALGTLPGDKDEKTAVLFKPLKDTVNKLIGASHAENLTRLNQIMYEPLGSILGSTYDDTLIVMDEAQVSTEGQMKALLTRVGQRSKIVIAGDYREQSFLPGRNGLEDAVQRFRYVPSVGHVDFTVDDIVRSGFCRDVILVYRGHMASPESEVLDTDDQD